MPHMNLTPDTVFAPKLLSRSEPLFAFACSKPAACEQEQYKLLINTELARQGTFCAHLADRINMPRTRMHKILKQGSPLSDSLRDQIFQEMGIDHVRAKISVALLNDHAAYFDQAVFLAAENLKGFFFEAKTAQRGSIEIEIRPAVVHQAARHTYDLLVVHQTRVLHFDHNLQR